MTSILGLDISSTQLDGCLLVDGQAPVLRRETLGKASEPLIERVRRVQWAVPRFLTDDVLMWSIAGCPKVVDWVVIEDAYGPSGKARKALDLTAGAIISSIPRGAQVALVRCADWRRELGAKNTKESGHRFVLETLLFGGLPFDGYDEHELDAIGIALAWQRILASQATPHGALNTRDGNERGDT